jgi:hypothetical protein
VTALLLLTNFIPVFKRQRKMYEAFQEV